MGTELEHRDFLRFSHLSVTYLGTDNGQASIFQGVKPVCGNGAWGIAGKHNFLRRYKIGNVSGIRLKVLSVHIRSALFFSSTAKCF